MRRTDASCFATEKPLMSASGEDRTFAWKTFRSFSRESLALDVSAAFRFLRPAKP